MKSFAEYRELEEAMGVDPISHKTYVKGGVPHSSRSVERHKFAITATVKGRGGKEEKIEQESHARGTKDEAEAKLRDHFTNRLGYKISSMKHMGVVKEEVDIQESVEIKPSEFHAVRKGDKTAEQLAAEKKKPVGMVKGELNLHADHWSQGEAHYNKLFKEEAELDEAHQVVAKTKQGETLRSAVYPTKEKALSMHYKMAKSGKYKSVETVPMKEEVECVAEGSLNEVTQGVEHSEWVDNVKDAHHPTQVRIVRKRTEDGRHVKSVAMIGDKLVGQYNMNTGVGTFKSAKQQGVAEGSLEEVSQQTLQSYRKKASAQKRAADDVVSGDADDETWKKNVNLSAKRRQGIDAANKRLGVAEEADQLEEMTQGKEYTQAQLQKKIQSGNWEATHDIKPGKHVEMRHHTGKRVTVYVKEESELGDLAHQKTMKHRFLVTYSDPNHTSASMRKEKQQKHVLVPGTKNGESVYKGDAEPLVKKYMNKQGYRVHEIEHVGMVSKRVNEHVDQLDEADRPSMSVGGVRRREDDEGYGKQKVTGKTSTSHFVHINGRHWKTFDTAADANRAKDAVKKKYPDKRVHVQTKTFYEEAEHVESTALKSFAAFAGEAN